MDKVGATGNALAASTRAAVLSGTIFEAGKLPLMSWYLAMQLLTPSKTNASALELRWHWGVCYRSGWLIKHTILEGMRLAEADRQPTGRVEIDDACLGGERSAGKAGRGLENKIAFVAAAQTTEVGQPHLAWLSPRPLTNRSIDDFIARHTVRPLTLVSDRLNCFQVAASAGTAHDREVTGGRGARPACSMRSQGRQHAHRQRKTALTGTYRSVNFAKYAYRCLAEVQFRYNRRNSLRAILGGLLAALVRAPWRPECGIRSAELHR